MTDKSDEGSNDALGRIAPRRKSLEEPKKPAQPKVLSINEGITLPKSAPKHKPIEAKPKPVSSPIPNVSEELKSPPPPEPPVEEALPEVQEVEEVEDELELEPELVQNEDELDEIIRGVRLDMPSKFSKYLYISLAAASIVVIAACVFYFFIYQKPSIYSKLTNESYSENSISFSFNYPQVLSQTSALAAKNPNILVAYDDSTGPDNTLVDLSALPDSQPLQSLKLSPSDILNQIRSGQGSYISLLNKGYPGNYKSLFGTCTRNMVNTNNQVFVVCSDNANGYDDTRLVGADRNYQYILQLYMSTPVWNDNQKVWQEVEKSFTW